MYILFIVPKSRGDGYGAFFGVMFQNHVAPFLFDAEYSSEQESAKKCIFVNYFFRSAIFSEAKLKF